jgi:hypothetical protein
MDYLDIKLELAAGKKVRRPEWKKGTYVVVVDGHLTMNGEMWYCGDSDANAKNWEVVEEKVKEPKVKEEVEKEPITEKEKKVVKVKLSEVEPEKENQVEVKEEKKK